MALHDFECPVCHRRVEDVFLTLSEISDPHHEMWCVQCEYVPMEQSFKNFKGFKPFTPYVDQHIAETPVEITSREQRRALMKKNNLVDFAVGHGEKGCVV